MEQEFIKFLKKHNALIPFICNLALGHIRAENKGADLTSYFIKRKGIYLITFAFFWGQTEEGSVYWNALDSKWQIIAREIWRK